MKRILIESRILSYFASVCHDRNLSLTAERLHIAKSVLSEACSQVENELGLSLFERRSQGMQPTEQGLFIAKYILFMQNLEQFALRLEAEQLNNIAYISLKIPERFWSPSINSLLAYILDESAQRYPTNLILPIIQDTQTVEGKSHQSHQGEEAYLQAYRWKPAWKHLGKINLALYTNKDVPSTHKILVSEPWYLIFPESSNYWPEPVSTEALKHYKILLPRMPWPMAQQAAQYCLAHHLSFEQVAEDLTSLLHQNQSIQKQSCILVNGLMLNVAKLSHWTASQLDEPLTIHLSAQTQDDQLLHAFKAIFISAWKKRHLPPPQWKPQTRLKQWLYFGETLAKGSISEAAKGLFLSQPALSMQLKQFEEHLNMRLISRKTGSRHLSLTESGNIIHQLHDGFFEQLHIIGEYVQQQRLSHSQRLLLGVLPSIDAQSRLSSIILNKAAAWLRHHHPETRLEIVEERHQYLMHSLRNQTLHLAITEADSPWTVQVPVDMPEQIGLVIATQLLQNPNVTTLSWQAVSTLPLVLPRRGSGLRSLIDNHCISQGLSLEATLESDSLNLNRAWIKQGQYGSILPKSAMASLLTEEGFEANTKVVFIPLVPTLERVLRLSHLKHRHLDSVEEGLIGYLAGQTSVKAH